MTNKIALRLQKLHVTFVYLALNQDQKLDEDLTFNINRDLTLKDRPLLRAIKCLESKMLSKLAALDWNSIKSTCPESPYLKVEEREQLIRRYLEYNIHDSQCALPITISVAKFSTTSDARN